MRKFGKATGVAVISALLMSAATPASAGIFGGVSVGSGYDGWRGDDGYGHGRRHHGRDRVSAGDVIGAVAIIGVIAAIASASKRATNRSDTNSSDDRSRNDTYRTRSNISTENDAANACAEAAESQGGSAASVRDITNVRQVRDGWDVEGVIEQRDGWRDRSADSKRFTCAVRYGAVENVNIERGVAFR